MIRTFAAFVVLATLSLAGVGYAGPLDDCAEHLPYGAPKVSTGHVTTICHKGYAAAVDNDALVPRWVAYHMTGKHTLGCNKRQNDFHPEEQLSTGHRALPADYAKSGYDKGHMADAADFSWSAAMLHDSFSMANMAPQLPHLNRDEWERLEETVRAWTFQRGDVEIYVGTVLGGKKTIGKDHVAVPVAFFKIVVDTSAGDVIAFEMPQKAIPKGDLAPWRKSVKEIEADAGEAFPLPENADREHVAALWSADMTAWRLAHKKACAK